MKNEYRHSLFHISKDWIKIIPFFLIPFCAFPNHFLNTIQYPDLARIYFSIVGLFCCVTLYKHTLKSIKSTIVIALAFLSLNQFANLSAAFNFDIPVIYSSIKLFLFIFILILIPLCGIIYTIRTLPERMLYQFYMIPIAIVLSVSVLQILTLLGVDFFLTHLYITTLFKYIEGVWIGFPRTQSNLFIEFRILGTFHEPSILATFITLYTIPFLSSRFVNGIYTFGKVADFVFIFLSFVILIFSFSTTSYTLMSLDFIVILYFYFIRKKSVKRFLVPLFLMLSVTYFVSVNYESYYQVISRAFIVHDVSTKTRIGSIQGAINLFIDNPLGVGFSNEKSVVFNYLPDWGKTIEATFEHSNIQSSFFRYLAAFGIGWLLFLLIIAGILLVSYKKAHAYMYPWQKDLLFIWLLNFLFAFLYGILEHNNQWFLFSTAVVLYPLFKKYPVTISAPMVKQCP